MPGSTESDLEFLSPSVWYLFGQEFLSDSYLQPYKKETFYLPEDSQSLPGKKTNVQNGYIEREMHGAMHASRVALATVMLHRLCQRQFPQIVEKHLTTLCAFTELTTDQLFCLICYVGLGHDAARQGEGYDEWERQSALMTEAFLCSKTLNPRLAKIFSRLSMYKDRPVELQDFLEALEIPTAVIESLQYARLLIRLADCFDIIRCNGAFKFKFIEAMLCDVFPYRKENDAIVFFDFAKHWFQLLKDQKDLYFPTILVGPDDEIYSLALGPDDYSLREKLRVEHADNVIVAILDSLKKNPYFKALLPTYGDISPTLYDSTELAFNPYIHGTTSTTLALMTKIRFRLMSPVELLKHYQLAPFSGEICRGGLRRAVSNGNSCFGKLIFFGSFYSLDAIITLYAQTRSVINEKYQILKLIEEIQNSDNSLWSNIIIINIYIARLRQLGVNLDSIRNLKGIIERINDAIDVYYLFLVFHKYLEAVGNASISSINCDLKDFLQKLKQNGISCAQIYQDPSPEKCQPLIDLLGAQQLSFRHASPTDVDPDAKEKSYRGDCYDEFKFYPSFYEAKRIFDDACTNHTYFQSRFRFSERTFIETIEALKCQLEITRKLLNEPLKPLQLSKKDSDFIRNPFPVIFVYDKEDAMRVAHTESGVEYRSQRPLMIGEDIRILATDTAENVRKLNDYCRRHSLPNVLIVTFDALKCARNTLRTEKPFTHSNISVQSPLQELHDFCAQQRQRLAQNGERVIRSINLFEEKASEIIKSKQMSANQTKLALKKCAHNLFGHRDFCKRLLADVLILISSLVLVGFAIGIGRVAYGHSFFFSGAKTEREHAFDDAADQMIFVM